MRSASASASASLRLAGAFAALALTHTSAAAAERSTYTYDQDRRAASSSTSSSRRSRTEALDRYDRERDRDRERSRRYERDDRDWFPVKDLRLTIGQAPGPDTITVDRYTGSPSAGSVDFDADGKQMTGGALTFSYGRLHAGGGPIVCTGVDLYQGSVTATVPGAVGSVDFDVERFGALIKFGYGVPFTDALHLEILPYLGVGFASASAQGGSGDSMVMGQLGLEAGLYYRFGLGRAGLVGGWNYFSGWGDTTMRGNGPQYGISVGFAF